MAITILLPAHLSSKRLLLRAPHVEDAATVFAAYAGREEVCRFTTFAPHANLGETQRFLERCLDREAGGLERTYLLELLDTPAMPVGAIAIRPHGDYLLDLGYVLGPAQWGRGLMSEAILAVAQAAFSTRCVRALTAVCDTENVASYRTLERAHFTRQEVLKQHLVRPRFGGAARDCYLYRLDI
jgi:[ribosomal protein S5]-alanine N-acetyltransferase